jgi:hypothetical protein
MGCWHSARTARLRHSRDCLSGRDGGSSVINHRENIIDVPQERLVPLMDAICAAEEQALEIRFFGGGAQ